jgi:hypothetical protein
VHWIRLFLDLFSEGEAIHVGHVPIQQISRKPRPSTWASATRAAWAFSTAVEFIPQRDSNPVSTRRLVELSSLFGLLYAHRANLARGSDDSRGGSAGSFFRGDRCNGDCEGS